MMSHKIYVLDTNVLLHDPKSLFTFDEANVIIPANVLEELDQFKRETTERGRNARAVSRQLDKLREFGSLKDGVKLENGSLIQVAFPISGDRPELLKKDTEDNQIIDLVYKLKQAGNDVTFITKDINARVKCDVLGIHAEDYLKGRVDEYDIYKGWKKINVPAVQLTKPVPDTLYEMAKAELIEINEYILVHSNNNEYNYKVYRYLGSSRFKQVVEPDLRWPIHARNPQQLMALDALCDPTVEMVCLVGPAGTGKTFLALVAGLHQILIEDLYKKMLISRPVIPLGPDIGYLPGDIQEKLHSWMQPMYDNMGIIVQAAQSAKQIDSSRDDYSDLRDKKRKKFKKQHARMELRSLDELVMTGKISIEAITYMRGRSIPYQYILIDEVQNLTPHEIKTIITRVGEGSKIVLSGDPYQIDSPYLDFSSNGLVVASNAFKGQPIFSTIFLETSERSELSKLASELL